MKPALLTIILLLAGCSIHESKETLRILIPPEKPQIAIEYESKVWQGLLLYFSKNRQVRRKTPLSTLFVGDMEAMPDPNALEPLGRGIIEGLIKLK